MTATRAIKSEHELWQVYSAMLDRCRNPHHEFWSSYGGRGITVAKEWQGRSGFWQFVADMGPRPEGTDGNGKSLWSIDRINNDGNYCKENCRWATASMQQFNRRRGKRENGFPGYSKSLLASLDRANVRHITVHYP